MQSNVLFQRGYWSFESLVERFGEEGVTLKANKHNGTCQVYSENAQVNLGYIGTLLGFEKSKVVPARTRADSSTANINLGLRYVTIGCDLVDRTRNLDRAQQPSNVIATLPVTTESSLNGSVTNFGVQKFTAPLKNGSVWGCDGL